jgi:hypothetical protein
MNYFKSTTSTESMLMRRATAADSARIWELARLDNKRLPAGPFLVAELDGSVEAAVSLSSGTVVADPFRLTADAVAMLKLRASQLTAGGADLAARRAGRARSDASQPSLDTAVAA